MMNLRHCPPNLRALFDGSVSIERKPYDEDRIIWVGQDMEETLAFLAAS